MSLRRSNTFHTSGTPIGYQFDTSADLLVFVGTDRPQLSAFTSELKLYPRSTLATSTLTWMEYLATKVVLPL